jgi:hypothetical protein
LNKRSAALVAFACALLAFAYYALLTRVEPFMYQFYLMAWWAYICFVDAVLARHTGRFLVFNKDVFFLVIMSAAFWCIFEAVNVRLQNWYYINVPERTPLRYGGYLLAYGTVIPAVSLTCELVRRILPPARAGRASPGAYSKCLILLGLACLGFALAFPTYCFALAWVFLAFVIDGYCYRTGRPSFLGDIENGNLGPLVAAGTGGMICGAFWEFWNYWAITKWVYTVPFFEDFKIFEMPAPGFLGFAFFAVEVMAFLRLLELPPRLFRSKWILSGLGLVFCGLVFVLIDHYTVFSHTARVDELPFLGSAGRAAIEATGAGTSYAIDTRLLTDEEKQRLALLQMKGLGLENYEALDRQGIHTIDRLARLDAQELSSVMHEKNMRRVRVYLKAARNYRRTTDAKSKD